MFAFLWLSGPVNVTPFGLARRRSLRWPRGLRSRWCREPWVGIVVEILQCGVTVKRVSPRPLPNLSIAIGSTTHSSPTSSRSLDRTAVSEGGREGVDVISSLNQGNLSILFALWLKDVRLESLAWINIVTESQVAATGPSGGMYRYYGCFWRKWI